MPHYKDGSECKVGDLVKGVGYSVRDEAGKPREFVGTVIGIVPDATSCNVRVAHAQAEKLPDGFQHADYRLYSAAPGVLLFDGYAVWSVVEYGEASSFEKVG